VKRGRKTSASNIISLAPNPSRPKVNPPSTLTEPEKRLFAETLDAFPHLDRSDSTLLASYAQATVKAMKLAKGNNIKGWDIAVRTQLALARSLRLTHQARTAPQTLGRRMADQPKVPAPWGRHSEG